jgi:hypothetical protein
MRFQSIEATVLAAPASQRLLALSWNSDTAGKLPALLLRAAQSGRHNNFSARERAEVPIVKSSRPLHRPCARHAGKADP